ncbi:hypothetical protein RJT34_18009 [Clitoria ternatea]|uniref:ARID domain-containing protein n=1 Tax=Clitoria ternatea TaxID=43366 RepID=A0AAN9JA01_CLITE
MMSNGQPVDLYKLFMVVKEKGGYDAVCENRLWDLVGEEYGLGIKVGSSVKLVYSKYLSVLETWPKYVADSKLPECGLVDDRVKFGELLMEAQAEILLDDYGEEEVGDGAKRRVYDYLDGRKLGGTNRVKGVNPELNGVELERIYNYLDDRKLCDSDGVKSMNPEPKDAENAQNGEHVDSMVLDHEMNEPVLENLCSLNTAMEIVDEFDGGKVLEVEVSEEVSNMPGLSDGGKVCDIDGDSNDDDVFILDPNRVNRERFSRKRKRGTMLEDNMLSWVTGIAKKPCDPSVGSLPEKSKWKSYTSQEIWKQVLLFREAVFLKKEFETISQHSWQDQKMHPSLYDDRLGGIYNLRQRLKGDKKLLLGKSTSNGVSSDSSRGTHGGLERTPSADTADCTEKQLLDSCAAVEIPIGPKHQAEVLEWNGMTYESDSKWLGTQIWPPETVNTMLFERDPIGMGREDSCGCAVHGSVECVRFHIAQKREKLKMELGEAFYQWNLEQVGEEVRRFWTVQEERKFKDVVKSNPPSLDKCFWDVLFSTFPMKSREDLVNYYFNVFLLQRRGYQNRHTPDNIDSDDDESECTPLRKVFGHQTPKSRSFTLLSPKKATGKRENCK